MLVVGLLLLVFRELLPVEALSAWSERAVGVALILVGAWGLRQARRAHAVHHLAAGASFGMGTLHGLAGSSHLFGVLPTLAFTSRADGRVVPRRFRSRRRAGDDRLRRSPGRGGTWSAASPGARRAFLYASSTAAVLVGGAWLLA